MKKAWEKLGTVAFWVSWPLIYLFLKRSKRTRVLIVAGDQVLVVKGWLGMHRWTLPGGGLKSNEDAAVGAARELKEETGISVSTDKLKLLGQNIFTVHGHKMECVCFVVEIDNALPLKTGRPELIDSAWMDYQELLKQNPSSSAKTLVEDWFKPGQ